MNMIVKIISKIFSRKRQDCTDSISTLVIIEENNNVLSDLPPSYASIFPIRVEIDIISLFPQFLKYIYGNKHFLFRYLIKF